MRQNAIDHGMTFEIGFLDAPEYPEDGLWVDDLRWLIMVMDCDDPYLAFVAGCFSNALYFGGLTDKQSKAIGRIKSRVIAAFDKGALDCQQGECE